MSIYPQVSSNGSANAQAFVCAVARFIRRRVGGGVVSAPPAAGMYVCMYVCVYVCMCMTLSDLNAANKTLSFISLSLRTRHCLLNEPCFIYFTGVNYLFYIKL